MLEPSDHTDFTALLAQGVSAWNQWRSQGYDAWFRSQAVSDPGWTCLDLQEINLQNAHLPRINFRDCDLRGANLRGADLSGAKLYCANLEDV